jgi:hypothetical protein
MVGGVQMNEKLNRCDVDEFVGGVPPDATAYEKTARFIEEYKKDPNYRFETEEAERILAALGINAQDYGMPDAKSLLEHWNACIADLEKADSDGTNGPARCTEEVRRGSALTGTEPG